MARIHVFGDEAGNFDFSTRPGASKYFILGTIVLDNPNVGEQLLRLRRDLAWRRFGLDSSFHATTDPQVIRDEVFSVIENLDFRIDSTIFEKRKAIPSLQIDERLYKTAWFYHLRHVIPATVQLDDDLMVVAASIGTRKRRRAIRNGIEDVVRQVSNTPDWRVAF